MSGNTNAAQADNAVAVAASGQPPDLPVGSANKAADHTVVVDMPEAKGLTDKAQSAQAMTVVSKARESGSIKAVRQEVKAAQEEEISPFGTPAMFIKLGVALLLVWTLGWMYMGTAWNPRARLRYLNVAVLDCDNGVPSGTNSSLPAAFTGSTSITSTLLAQSMWNPANPAHRLFKWTNFTCSALSKLSPPYSGPGCRADVAAACLAELEHSLLQGNYWGGIYFPANITSNIVNNAGLNPNATAPFSAAPMLWIKTTGRHMTAFSMVDAVVKVFWQGLAQGLGKAYAADSRFAAKMSPFFFINPLPLSTIDLAPVQLFGQNLATYMLQLLTWMTAIVLTAVFYGHRLAVETPEKLPESFIPTAMHVAGALVLRLLTCATIVLVASCLNLLIVVFLGIGSGVGAQFDGFNAGYAIAFMWYCGMTYLAIMTVAIKTFGPVKYSTFGSFFLILQLVSSSAIFPHELSNPFFRIGFALPLTWGVRGLRMIFFGAATNKIWRSWLVLTAWLVVCTAIAMALWWRSTMQRLKGKMGRGWQDSSLAREESLERELSSATLAYPLTA